MLELLIDVARRAGPRTYEPAKDRSVETGEPTKATDEWYIVQGETELLLVRLTQFAKSSEPRDLLRLSAEAGLALTSELLNVPTFDILDRIPLERDLGEPQAKRPRSLLQRLIDDGSALQDGPGGRWQYLAQDPLRPGVVRIYTLPETSLASSGQENDPTSHEPSNDTTPATEPTQTEVVSLVTAVVDKTARTNERDPFAQTYEWYLFKRPDGTYQLLDDAEQPLLINVEEQVFIIRELLTKMRVVIEKGENELSEFSRVEYELLGSLAELEERGKIGVKLTSTFRSKEPPLVVKIIEEESGSDTDEVSDVLTFRPEMTKSVLPQVGTTVPELVTLEPNTKWQDPLQDTDLDHKEASSTPTEIGQTLFGFSAVVEQLPLSVHPSLSKLRTTKSEPSRVVTHVHRVVEEVVTERYSSSNGTVRTRKNASGSRGLNQRHGDASIKQQSAVETNVRLRPLQAVERAKSSVRSDGIYFNVPRTSDDQEVLPPRKVPKENVAYEAPIVPVPSQTTRPKEQVAVTQSRPDQTVTLGVMTVPPIPGVLDVVMGDTGRPKEQTSRTSPTRSAPLFEPPADPVPVFREQETNMLVRAPRETTQATPHATNIKMKSATRKATTVNQDVKAAEIGQRTTQAVRRTITQSPKRKRQQTKVTTLTPIDVTLPVATNLRENTLERREERSVTIFRSTTNPDRSATFHGTQPSLHPTMTTRKSVRRAAAAAAEPFGEPNTAKAVIELVELRTAHRRGLRSFVVDYHHEGQLTPQRVRRLEQFLEVVATFSIHIKVETDRLICRLLDDTVAHRAQFLSSVQHCATSIASDGSCTFAFTD